ncbi:TlpA family protein disulfide reductase [Chitinophaga eiseniae]|uniref:TlpA family protein disulfide reductase n=1 Tax=Chitinophaga eiseniae TaxID=634771 RepID=A0A847SVB6_9BACT|nr:TlpA disulfide reductase family protein [Chitinophaga eiseniae]NLR80692.1 TlpA family protein disulfide reductase [Chitinophaga eiseniae]
MKSFPRLSFVNAILLIVAFAGLAAQRYHHDASRTTITFKLDKGSRLFISYPLNIVQFKEIHLPTITADSSFTITVETEIPFIVNNLNKTRTPYLFFPGYDYTAHVRENESDIRFQCGSDAQKTAESNVLREIETATYQFNLSLSPVAMKYVYQSRQYGRSLDSFLLALKGRRLEKIEEYRNTNKISSEGGRFLTAYVFYDFLGARLMPFYYPNFDLQQLPDWYADTIRQYQHVFNDASLLRLYSFQGALIYANRFLALNAAKGTYALGDQFTAAKNFTASVPVNDFLLYQVLNNHRNKEDRDYARYVDAFKTGCSDTLYRRIIQDNFEYMVKENTLPASVSQAFTLGKKMVKLDSLLTKQKKLIYLDCWASWCAPCRSEMPSSAKLQQLFAGKDISFVFLSLDQDPGQWRRAVGDYPFMNAGNSFVLMGSNQSSFVKQHRIHSIPRYILLRNNGQIISEDAPRPGDPQAAELINKHL